jgi:DsbC/DsbD-like thiol-disulfide interchange protein
MCYDKSEVFPSHVAHVGRGSCDSTLEEGVFLYMCAHYCLTFLKHLSVGVTNPLKHLSFYDKPI